MNDHNNMDIIPRQRAMYEQIDWLLNYIQPNEIAQNRREEVKSKAIEILEKSLGNSVFPCGSFPLKTYLANGDLDLVMISKKTESDSNEMCDNEIVNVTTALCHEAVSQDHKDGTNGSLCLRNVNFVNARTKIVTCIIGSMSVDITVNQISSLAAAVLIEEANKFFPNDLIKRSILLLKAWGTYEAPKYAGVGIPVLGAKSSGLTSYALNIMILRLFSLGKVNYLSPLDVLMAYFREYSSFDWSNYCLTLGGCVPISMVEDELKDSHHIFTPLVDQLQTRIEEVNLSYPSPKKFQPRSCNIQDPLNRSNNIGFSVTIPVLRAFTLALRKGKEHMESLINHSGSIMRRQYQLSNQSSRSGSPQPPQSNFPAHTFPLNAMQQRQMAYRSQINNQNQQREQIKYYQKQQNEMAGTSFSLRKIPLMPQGTKGENSPVRSRSKSITHYSDLSPVVSPTFGPMQATMLSPIHIKSPTENSSKCSSPNSNLNISRTSAENDFIKENKFEEPIQNHWFLMAMFPHVLREYCTGDGFRKDLLEHPHQKWSTLQQTGNPKPIKLSGNLSNMWAAFECAYRSLKNETKMSSKVAETNQVMSKDKVDDFSKTGNTSNSKNKCLETNHNLHLEAIIDKPTTKLIIEHENVFKKDNSIHSLEPNATKFEIPESTPDRSMEESAREEATEHECVQTISDPRKIVENTKSNIEVGLIALLYFLNASHMFVLHWISVLLDQKKREEENEATSKTKMWVLMGCNAILGTNQTKEDGSTIQWFKNGKIISGASESLYNIVNIDEGHVGRYTCVSFSSGIQLSSSILAEIDLKISSPPKITNCTSRQKLNHGGVLALHVQASGSPDPKYQWNLDGKPIEGANEPTFLKLNVTEADSGWYTCNVYNLGGRVEWQGALVSLESHPKTK